MRVLVMYVVLFLMSPMSFAVPVVRQVNISTEIEKNNFSFGEFVEVEFIPNSFSVEFSSRIKTFKDIESHLSVTTNLSTSDANNGFLIQIGDSSVVCFDSTGNEVQLSGSSDSDTYGFAKLHVDGNPVPIESGVLIEKFNVVNAGMWGGYYPVHISFSALSLSDLNEGKCSGNISVHVEFNI